MTGHDPVLFLFFKGNENHWTEAGGSKPLWSRKRSPTWKTPVSTELYFNIKGQPPANVIATLVHSLCCLSVFIGCKCGQAIQPVSSAQMEACTCVWMCLTKSCGMTLCWMSCEFAQQINSSRFTDKFKFIRLCVFSFGGLIFSGKTG